MWFSILLLNTFNVSTCLVFFLRLQLKRKMKIMSSQRQSVPSSFSVIKFHELENMRKVNLSYQYVQLFIYASIS